MEIRTWWLDPQQIDDTKDKIEKINARAAKHGLHGRYSVRIGATRTEPVYDGAGARLVIDGIPHYLDKGQPVPCPQVGERVVTEFTVEGEPPQLGDWRLLATLTFDEGTFIARSVPGFDEKISADDFREGWCDHCKTDRVRHDTYLVAHAGTGERQQVGSTCIKDFLGHSVSAAMSLTDDDLDEVERGIRLSGGWDSVSPRYVIERAVALIRQSGGWVSRDAAEIKMCESSSQTLRRILFPASRKDRMLAATTIATEDDLLEAKTVTAWIAELDTSDSNYLDSIQRLAAADFVSSRNTGILGSAVAAWHRETAEKIEREARDKSDWIGTVGKREVFELTIIKVTWIEDNYSYHGESKPLYTFKDQHGNIVKWFASRGQFHGAGVWEARAAKVNGTPVLEWAEGDTVKIKGTVKKHDEYHGVKQTQLTRCAIVEEKA